MKFLANENFPFPSISLLRLSGYEVSSVSELFPGIPDHEVVKIAQAENLIILTFDKDYGELIFKYSTAKPPAVIFFRFKGDYPERAGEILNELLQTEIQFHSKFSVIENGNIRQRQYDLS
jgi:predicted nuclease of predicted toxin-antitoxin system